MKKIYLMLLCAFWFIGANAQNDCASAVPITIPYSSGTLTTCGTGDDYAAGSYFNSNYGDGEDYVFTFTVTNAPVTYQVSLGGSATWKIASFHSACPPSSANVIGGIVTGSGSTASGNIAISTNGTYYVFVDTYPSPLCGEFTLTITPPPPAPANDEPGAAVALTVNSDLLCAATTAGTTISATASAEVAPGCSATGTNDDVWYTFVATNVNQTITFTGTSNTMAAALYTGTPGSLALVTGACASTTLAATGLTVGQTYYVRAYTISSTAGIGSNFTICVGTPPPPPANDVCSGAIVIPPTGPFPYLTGATSNANATDTNDPVNTCQSNAHKALWYAFTPAVSGSYEISSCQSDAPLSNISDNVLAVYTSAADCAGPFTQISCDDDGCNSLGLQGVISSIPLTGGTTYYILVAGYNTNVGDVQLSIKQVAPPPPPPANDDCSGAISLTVNSDLSCAVVTAGSTLYATQSAGETDPTCAATGINDDIWYKFTATNSSHVITLTSDSGSTDRAMQVYSGSCGSLVAVQCSDPESFTVTGLTAATEYYLRIYTYSSTSTVRSKFNICIGTLPPPPANDESAGAIALTVNSNYDCGVTTSGTTASATQSADAAPTCSATGINDDVWYTFTATNAAHRISFSGTSNTMAAALYSGTAGSLTFITGACASTTLNATGLTIGETYYVRAYTTSSTVATYSNFNICVGTPPPPPTNDDAPTAIALTVNAGCPGTNFSNVLATQSANEPTGSCSSTTGYATVWFKFVAPTSGAVRISTDEGTGNTLTDSRVALFSATDVNDYATFTIIGCDEDGGSVLGSGFMSVLYSTGLVAGNTYYIQVDKYSSSSTEGSFCLTVDELNSSMLSTSTNCASGQSNAGSIASYTGWVNLMDVNSKLIASVRNAAGGSASGYTSKSQNINAGAVRTSNLGTAYLDRNYLIANSSATNVEVQFYFLASELAALNTVDGTTLSTLGVSRQAGNTCRNDFSTANGIPERLSQTGNGTTADGLVNWVTVNTPSFSNFYLHKATEVLPITLEYFKGFKQDKSKNQLSWKIDCNNAANNTLILERSADQQSFTAIQSLTTQSTDACNLPFIYNDTKANAGMNYYRLKMVDVDGSFRYSNIVALYNGNQAFELVGLAPNPVKNLTNLNIASDKSVVMNLSITDIAGRKISTQKVQLVTGQNTISLDFSKLASGTYQITGITADATLQTIRFVKQ